MYIQGCRFKVTESGGFRACINFKSIPNEVFKTEKIDWQLACPLSYALSGSVLSL